MLDFLSDEWLDALAECLAALPEAEEEIVVGEIVTEVPWLAGGELRYSIRLGGDGGSSVTRGSIEDAEVVLVASYEDVAALAKGDRTATELLEAGSVKIRGDASRLVAAGGLLETAGRAATALRSRTRVL